MFAKRVPPQSGSRMSTVHGSLPPARMKNVEWVISTLRNVTSMFVRLFQGHLKELSIRITIKAMYYDDGSYAESMKSSLTLNRLDWYLETTGQRLVGEAVPLHQLTSHGSSNLHLEHQMLVVIGDGPTRCHIWSILILRLGKVGQLSTFFMVI
ncbi:MAG: hypothetical protein ACLS3V_05095 [Streptococcus sp.]